MIQENDWELEAPYPEIMGPFAYKDNQWVGFDDEDTIIEKVYNISNNYILLYVFII